MIIANHRLSCNIWWLLPDLNWGHKALQASALPTELKSHDVSQRSYCTKIAHISQQCYNYIDVRVSYNGYYVTFPRLRREFDSPHPHHKLAIKEKSMKSFPSTIQRLYVPTIVLLPIWVFIGRSLVLRDNGLFMFVIFNILPLMLPVILSIVLYTPYSLMPKYTDGIKKPTISKDSAILLASTCGIIFLSTLFTVGDISPSDASGSRSIYDSTYASLVTNVIGSDFVYISTVIGMSLSILSLLAIITLYVHAIHERRNARKMPTIATSQVSSTR